MEISDGIFRGIPTPGASRLLEMPISWENSLHWKNAGIATGDCHRGILFARRVV